MRRRLHLVDPGGYNVVRTRHSFRSRLPNSMEDNVKLMIVAGESSGDAHAAELVKALREQRPNTEFDFFGSAGRRMREAGVEAVVEAERMAIIGGLEIARELPMFVRSYRQLKKAAREREPDAVILVDFPDFNLRLAKSLKKRGHRVIYYISPQLWAWKKGRLKNIEKSVDRMLTILPFEEEFYRKNGFEKVTYVGSPIVSQIGANRSRQQFCENHGLDPEAKIVALLPGSRKVEIRHIAPVLTETARLMSASDPSLQFVVPLAPARGLAEFIAAASSSNTRGALPANLVFVQGETLDALAASDAAAVTSGTATLEAAVIGTPMAVIYKVSWLNYKAIRPFVEIDTFGLVNLIAGRKVAKELIQDELTAESLASELQRLLDTDTNREMRQELAGIKEILGTEDASANAAREVIRTIEGD